MENLKLYQYAIFYVPTKEEVKEEKMGPTLISDVKSIIATDEKEVTIKVAREIPEQYIDRLKNITIVIRPF
jgi:hypothetical protein